MRTLRETAMYEFVEDRLQGVGRFVRKSDGEVSPMMTGTELEFYKEELLLLTDNGFNEEAATLF